MVNAILAILLTVIYIGLIFFAIVFIVHFLGMLYKMRKAHKKNPHKYKLRYRFGHFRWHFRDYRFPGVYEFIKWVIIDFCRGKDKLKLFGIWAFTGYYGEGKTMGCIQFALNLRRKYPARNIQIYTNFELRGQNGRITKWEDLLELPRNTIVIFDEIQSTFSSQRFKDFPMDLLWKLTQCRKQQLAIFCTTPVYSRMVIQLRESTDFVIVCKNALKLDRWFNYEFYRAPDFEKFADFDEKMLRKKRHLVYNVITQDRDYKTYNTEQIVDRLDVVGEEEPKRGKSVNQTQEFKKLKDEILREVELRIKKISKGMA